MKSVPNIMSKNKKKKTKSNVIAKRGTSRRGTSQVVKRLPVKRECLSAIQYSANDMTVCYLTIVNGLKNTNFLKHLVCNDKACYAIL